MTFALSTAMVVLFARASVLPAVEKSPEPLHAAIDRLIASAQPDFARKVSARSDDAEFLRRVTLDLNGTIATSEEARAFLDSRDPGKRQNLLDELLARPAYARRMALWFDVMVMERRADALVARAEWELFLRNAFDTNLPYDRLVRRILAADGTEKSRAPAKFYLDRKFEPNLVTRDISRLFLGRDIQCAQCHDHPNIEDFTQAEFHGILAFLNRSFLFPNADDPKAVLAEKADGEVQFVSVFDKSKMQKSASPKLLNGKPIAEPKLEKGREYTVAPAKDVRPVPVFSRRERLAQSIATAENRAFARTAVNRLWAMMMGRGLVHPVELDHSGNPASHPELLDLLTQRFIDHRFDVKWFLRELALSETYQRSSIVRTEAPPELYLRASLKPLSPEQFAESFLQGTGFTDAERRGIGRWRTDEWRDPKLAPHRANITRVFAGVAGQPEEFSATLSQSLYLKNNGYVTGFFAPRRGNLADRLVVLKEPSAMADELFISLLNRKPTDDERNDVTALLKAQAKDVKPALADLMQAIVSSNEFRFNH